MDELRLWELSTNMIQGEFSQSEGSKTVRLSHVDLALLLKRSTTQLEITFLALK